MSTLYPRVGVGVILTNGQGLVLLGKRKGSYAPYWSIPGGHLELGESFESAAIREVAEETGLEIRAPEVVAVTNNLETWHESGLHYISVTLHARADGVPQLLEPEKCEGWIWCDPQDLPQPHFDASRQSIACWLAGRCYLPSDLPMVSAESAELS
ncbi:nucleotide triphosphate diphosphatase NUDT15 [Aeromonas sobria]|uniref:nucleotide triphosphate diphosphatase NUDT15 n=1 Tax=Aeromonas sobria TaxID=646 RepID=UPI0026ED30B0|nr:NUDIX hydrolase [Aeromonas sobria]